MRDQYTMILKYGQVKIRDISHNSEIRDFSNEMFAGTSSFILISLL